MRTSIKLAFGALTAALLLAAVVGTASANNLGINSEEVYIEWDPLTFSSRPGAEGIVIRCGVTLLSHFHELVISKEPGTLLGTIDHVEVAERACTGGVADALDETIPWHVVFRGWGESLPEIEHVDLDLVGAEFRIAISVIGIPVNCLYMSEARNPAVGIANVEAGGVVTSLTPDGDVPLPGDPDNSGLCPAQGYFTGSGAVEDGSAGDIEIILV